MTKAAHRRYAPYLTNLRTPLAMHLRHTLTLQGRTCHQFKRERRHRQGASAGLLEVDARVLNRRLAVHWVSDRELVALSPRDVEAFRLDPGERHLWAHVLGRSDAWVASSADRAAINAAVRLGWEDRLVSFEELANQRARGLH